MAASVQGVARILWRLTPSVWKTLRIYQPCLQKLSPSGSLSPMSLPSHTYCQAASLQDEGAAQAVEALSRYKEKPWEYLESEEYIDKYGSTPVWKGYRRNHKGGIPPQKTRKTCINVKLLEQFISPYTGVVYDPSKTGVCMKQQKKLTEAIAASRDHGFLPFQIPYVDFTKEDYSNSHDAVGSTPPPPLLTSGESWYKWYSQITPDESQVAKVKRKYKAYLK
ncbi:unnamed protein product [Knipowitschia caucasica]